MSIKWQWDLLPEDHKDWWITEAMVTYGGGFVEHLGYLYRRADLRNKARLKKAFPDYWEEYSGFALEMWAQDQPRPEESA